METKIKINFQIRQIRVILDLFGKQENVNQTLMMINI